MNSTPSVGDFSSKKSFLSSPAQLLRMSPESAITLSTFACSMAANSRSRAAGLIPEAGPIGGDLVIVEAHDEGGGSVRSLQIEVEFVEAVAIPVVVERKGLVDIVRHRPRGAGTPDAVLVDIVAVVVHEIEP